MRRYVLVAAVLAIIIGGCGEATNSNVTTSTALVEPDGTTLDADAIPIAMAAIEAWNTSVSEFQGQFALDGTYAGLPVTDSRAVNEMSFYIGLGDVVTVHSCETTAIDGRVDCRVTGRDAVSGVVGAAFEGTAKMRIANDQIVAFEWIGGGGKLSYNDEMVYWVREHHPIVFEESFADPTCTAARYDCYGDWAVTGAAAAALRVLHDEYLSSSSDNFADAVDTAREPDLLEPQYDVITATVSTDQTRNVWVYQPDGVGPWPVIYAIPGGGGDARRDFDTVATELARRGVLVFATDWAAEPGSYADTECGYRLTLNVAQDYGGDLSRPVVVVGFSLGATAALDLALGEADFGPGGDLASCFEGAPRPDAAVALSGCHSRLGFGTETDGWGNGDAHLVLATGANDGTCSLFHSVKAGEALDEAGYDVSVFKIPDAVHGDVVFRDLEWEPLPPDHPPGQYTIQIILDAIQDAELN